MEIQKINLLQEELVLYDSIPFLKKGVELSHGDVERASSAAVSLVRSLLRRKAIPDIRIRYFTEPEFNTHSKNSYRQIFEKNGSSGEEIYKSPHFWPFLRYFINGPDLPNDTKENFIRIVSSEPYISGSDMSRLRQFVRSETRRRVFNPKTASEEFYKLALECGIEEYLARMIRDAVHTIR